MTYRERRERKLERLEGWADSREAKADGAFNASHAATAAIPFGQPILLGHHSQRRHERDLERSRSAASAGLEHSRKASDFRSRAENIGHQLATSIYSDDVDAVERLQDKLAKLEAQREAVKSANAEWLKANREATKGMSAYERDRARPYPGYVLTNLGGVITNTRKRVAELERLAEIRESGERVGGRRMFAKYAGTCAECGGAVEKGESMTYYRATREVVCERCSA